MRTMNNGLRPLMSPEPALGATLYPNGSVGAAEADANPTAPTEPAAVPASVEVKNAVDAVPPPVLTTPSDPAATATAEGLPSEETPTTAAEPPSLTVDSYNDLALPEGLEVDQSLLTDAKKLFAETGIAPDKAPALLGLYKSALERNQAATLEAIRAQDSTWVAELSTLPEFQGERRAQSSTIIGRAIDEFGTPEVRSTLDAYGLGNNPALARFILRLASAATEGTPTATGNPPPTSKDGKPLSRSLGARLYGDSSKQ